MKKRIIAFVVVASLLLMLLAPTAKASTSVYKDYKPQKPLVRNWILGFYGLRLETKSELSNLVVRAYSDKEIRVWGDFEAYGAALVTNILVQVITAEYATVNVNSFTWNGLSKWHITYSDVIVGRDPRWPGVQFVAWGGGSGSFDVTISGITPDEDVFGVVVSIGNVGAALAAIFDIFKLATVPADTLAIIFSIKDAVRMGYNIASLLVSPHTFKATDEWPKASGAPAVATPKPDRTEVVYPFAVYYDERYPTDWISRDEAEAIRNYLSMRGFTVLDADDLKTFMEDEGKQGVVVMAQDVVPDTVAYTPLPFIPPDNPLIRQYLDRGGRVVWIGNTPFYYQGHVDGTKTWWGTEGILRILGLVSRSSWSVGTVTITADGAEAGLTQTWYSVSARAYVWAVTKVYASVSYEEDVAAWMKSFNNGGEFRRMWDSEEEDFTSEAYLQDLITVATTGSLSWKVEMTAYNADPDFARCGDININGYKERVISWINPCAVATVTTTVPGYWFNHELNAINAWVTTIDDYDNGNSWITVKLTSPEGFKIQYYKMKPANLDHKAYFEIEMTGLWRVTTYRYNTSPTALAYNLPDTHTYNTGSRTTGSFMFTVDLKLCGSSTLEFYHCYWTESRSDGAYDVLRVQISTDLGETWTTLKQWDSRDPNVESWTKVSLDTSSQCGHLVQIRFHFDSCDSSYNNYEGWYIDDITITGNLLPATPSTPSALTDATPLVYRELWYSTSTTDPDGDDVRYEFDWGDGTTYLTGWYASGDAASAMHAWQAVGTYYVKVRAQDARGLWSGWSPSLVVTIIYGQGPGSCPFIFSWDGQQYHFEHEAYPFAVMKSVETTSFDRLKYLRDVDGEYRLKIEQVLHEITWIDSFDLYVVDHPGEDSFVMQDLEGDFHTIKELIQPISAYEKNGDDCLEDVKYLDDRTWKDSILDADVNDESTLRNWITLTFAKPAEEATTAKLLLSVEKQETITKEWEFFIDAIGENYWKDWQKIMEDPLYTQLFLDMLEREIKLRIEVWNGTEWILQNSISAGDSIWDDFLVVLDISDVEGDQLQIRLKSTTGHYEINYVGIDYSEDEPIIIHKIKPYHAIKNEDENVLGTLIKSDENYEKLIPNDIIELKYKAVPKSEWKRDYTIAIKGYYNFIDFQDQSYSGFLEGTELWMKALTEPYFVAKTVFPYLQEFQ